MCESVHHGDELCSVQVDDLLFASCRCIQQPLILHVSGCGTTKEEPSRSEVTCDQGKEEDVRDGPALVYLMSIDAQGKMHVMCTP